MKKIFLIITGIMIFSSCEEDFLDQFPPQQLTAGNFYETEDQMIQAGNAVYNELKTVWGVLSLPYIFGDLYGGDSYIYLSPGTAGDWVELGNTVADPGLSPPAGAWNEYYQGIFNVNDFLEELDGFDESKFSSPDMESMLRAQALFVRASFYYYLSEVFGDVPLVTSVLTPSEAIVLTRNPKSAVVAQIIEDLSFAANNLPGSYDADDAGRPTSYAAKAMLARVYMANGDNSSAESQLSDIINSGMFSLDSDGNGTVDPQDYLHIFDDDTRNSPSAILELQYIPGAAGKHHAYGVAYAPFPRLEIPGYDLEPETFGLGAVSDALHNAFEPADSIRQKITSVREKSDGTFWPHTAKYYWGYDDGTPYLFGSNVTIIRYAEILLNYAELTGDPQYLNMVRERAGLPGWGEPGYPTNLYPTFAEALEHERRVELAFEFQRGFDLKRTGRLLEVKSEEQGRSIPAHQLVLPIPTPVLDVNVQMTQTTGY